MRPLAPELTPQTRRDAAVRAIAGALAEAGVENARRDARLILCAALGLTAAQLLANGDAPLGDAAAGLAGYAARRAAREPFARIVGSKEFYGLDFRLCPETLVPRADTETLVDAVLEHARARGLDRPPAAIIDIGTGSGAILLAALANLPLARGIGTDLAEGAVAMAAANAQSLGLTERTSFHHGAWFAGLNGPFDIIVSNPPYIPSADIAGLEPEVRDGDPRLALDGGPDGLEPYRILARDAPARLAQGGLVAVEIGIGQDGDVAALFAAAGLRLLEARKDLGGVVRALVFAPAD